MSFFHHEFNPQPIILNKLWSSITNCHGKQLWQNILTKIWHISQFLTKFIRWCNNVIGNARIQISIHNPKRVQLSHMVTTYLQETRGPPTNMGAERKTTPQGKDIEGGESGHRRGSAEQQENKNVEMEWDGRWNECRVQGYKSWKTGERRKWEKEGQIKGRGSDNHTKQAHLMMVCWAVGYRKHFSPTCWNPVATGTRQNLHTDAKWVEACIVMPHYLETRQQQSQDIRSSPSRSHELWIEPNLSQRHKREMLNDTNQNEVLHNLPFSIKRDYLLEVEQYIIYQLIGTFMEPFICFMNQRLLGESAVMVGEPDHLF